MSGDHNMYQKSKSYLDDFECPRCGHCCQALKEKQEPVAWISEGGDVSRSKRYRRWRVIQYRNRTTTERTKLRDKNDYDTGR